MKHRTLTLVVLFNLVALVALAVTMPQFMVSPGNVIDGHAELAGDCFACHTPFLGSSPEKCVQCHKVDEIGLKTTRGVPIGGEKKNVAFHQDLRENDCIACHSYHKGVQAFRPIGQFSHGLLQPDVQEACGSCHARPADALHRGTDDRCATCHSQEAWKPATFDHDQYFVFDRDHSAPCSTCHVNNDYASYTCYGCHEHSRAGIRAEHLEEGIRDYEDCVACHRSGDEDEAKYMMRRRLYGPDGGNRRDYWPAYERERRHGADHD